MLKYIIAAAAVLFTAGAAWACPSYSSTGASYNYSTTQLAAPHAINITAGGNVNLSGCVSGWYGYTISRPDVTVYYNRNTNGRALEFRTRGSGCDTILVVNDANGNWYYNDDGGSGLNARIRLQNAPGGRYDIWVGTYNPSLCNTQLVTETWR